MLDTTRKRMTSSLALISGVALIGTAPAPAAIHTVNVMNFAFDPSTIAIAEGDTVRWQWIQGSHTTTSGDGGTCTPDGLWNAPIDSANPTFELQFDAAGEYSYFCVPHCPLGMTGLVTVEAPIGVADPAAVPEAGLLLEANVPNPFTPLTTIRYQIPANGLVRLTIHDTSGRAVCTLVDEQQAAGEHAVDWNGVDASGKKVAAGIYFARLEADGARQARRLVLLR